MVHSLQKMLLAVALLFVSEVCFGDYAEVESLYQKGTVPDHVQFFYTGRCFYQNDVNSPYAAALFGYYSKFAGDDVDTNVLYVNYVVRPNYFDDLSDPKKFNYVWGWIREQLINQQNTYIEIVDNSFYTHFLGEFWGAKHDRDLFLRMSGKDYVLRVVETHKKKKETIVDNTVYCHFTNKALD